MTVRQTDPKPVNDTKYLYDAAGNPTKVVDTAAAGPTDTQCFNYDYAQRLTDAWIPGSGDCTQSRSAAALGGPAPYWQSSTFDASGDRATQVIHGTAGDTTATSTYPSAGSHSVRPHAVSSISTVGPGINRTDSYNYDADGNTTGRPGPTASQVLAWDPEGHLSKVAENGKDTTYLYDADGARLIQNDPFRATLYLPGEDVVYDKNTATTTATR